MNTLLAVAELSNEVGLNSAFLIAQIINSVIVIALAFFAIRRILKNGKGVEVPVWITLSILIPVILPICALIHFRDKPSSPTN